MVMSTLLVFSLNKASHNYLYMIEKEGILNNLPNFNYYKIIN